MGGMGWVGFPIERDDRGICKRVPFSGAVCAALVLPSDIRNARVEIGSKSELIVSLLRGRSGR